MITLRCIFNDFLPYTVPTKRYPFAFPPKLEETPNSLRADFGRTGCPLLWCIRISGFRVYKAHVTLDSFNHYLVLSLDHDPRFLEGLGPCVIWCFFFNLNSLLFSDRKICIIAQDEEQKQVHKVSCSMS